MIAGNLAAERDGDVLELALDRPAVRNALNPALLAALREAIVAAPEAGVRAVLLFGKGSGFCAGADLSAAGERDPGANLLEHYHPVACAIANSPIPVVAAVHGVAAGGGVGLALLADIVVMERTARLSFPFARLGLVPDLGAAWLLVRSIGRARTLDLALTGGEIGGEAAHAAGLVSRLADDGAALRDARDLARRLAAMPTTALGLIRHQVGRALDDGFQDCLAMEAEMQSRAGRTEDFREGVAAFRERRAPRFVGR